VTRVFWDSMLFIYLLEGHRKYAPRVRTLLERSYQRNDLLLTSYLALAEMLVGASASTADTVLSTVEEMGFSFIQFDRECVEPFRSLRAKHGLRGPDAMHLACAAAAGTDLLLTGDEQLLKKGLHLPGIHFIASFENAPL
jgi:predicted nucleic acid-binding protein